MDRILGMLNQGGGGGADRGDVTLNDTQEEVWRLTCCYWLRFRYHR